MKELTGYIVLNMLVLAGFNSPKALIMFLICLFLVVAGLLCVILWVLKSPILDDHPGGRDCRDKIKSRTNHGHGTNRVRMASAEGKRNTLELTQKRARA